MDTRSETSSARCSSCPRCYTGKSLPQASRALSQIIQSQSSVEKALLQKCCKDPPPRPTSVAALDHFPAWRGAQAHAGGNQTNCPSFRVVLVIPKSMSVGDYAEPNTNTLTPPSYTIDQLSRSLRRQSDAHAYTECSALTGLGVKDVFDEAVLAALLPR